MKIKLNGQCEQNSGNQTCRPRHGARRKTQPPVCGQPRISNAPHRPCPSAEAQSAGESIPVDYFDSSSPDHHWRKETLPGVSLELAQRNPRFGYQYVLYLRATGQTVGIVRQVTPEDSKPYLGPVRTTWISGDKIEGKSHWSLLS